MSRSSDLGNFAGFLPDGSALSSFRVVSAFRRAGGVARLAGLQAKAATAATVCPPAAAAATPAEPQLTYSLRYQAAVPLPAADAAVAAPIVAGYTWSLESGKQRCAHLLTAFAPHMLHEL